MAGTAGHLVQHLVRETGMRWMVKDYVNTYYPKMVSSADAERKCMVKNAPPRF